MSNVGALQERNREQEEPARLRYDAIEPLYMLLSVSVIILSGILGNSSYWTLTDGSLGYLRTSFGVGLLAVVVYLPVSHMLGLSKFEILIRKDLPLAYILIAWISSFLVVIVCLFLLKIGEQISRGSMIFFAIFGLFGAILCKEIASKILRTAVVNGTIAGKAGIVVGTKEELARLSSRKLLTRFGIAEKSCFTFSSNLTCSEISEIISNVSATSRLTTADQIVLAIPWANRGQLECILEHLRASPLPVRLLPDRTISTVISLQRGASPQMMVLDLKRGPLNRMELLSKRILDISIAAIALIILAPLMILAALAIKLETPGPIIFRQRRRGFNGREFRIHKFRTMKVLEDGPRFTQAKKGDNRVTRVGSILRKTSIDELPQLIDVLKGHMSIVGPRPHPVALDDEYETLIAKYACRHNVKPGITGWAQVNGCRGETPRVEIMEKRVHHDLWYIDNWSLRLDILTILRTFSELMRIRNVY